MNSDKQNRLNQIKADILKNNVCPNLAQTAKQLVMGEGNPGAEIVFIGEAPGAKEDESGMPFIGASGKLLNEMLASINLEREDVFITNIVKYRPPKNRDPSVDEKKAFMPYLLAQLEVIKPKIVAPLGRHSMNVFLPDAVISEAHGKLFESEHGYKLMPLYHPAAAIYNRKLRETVFTDFAAIPEQLK